MTPSTAFAIVKKIIKDKRGDMSNYIAMLMGVVLISSLINMSVIMYRMWTVKDTIEHMAGFVAQSQTIYGCYTESTQQGLEIMAEDNGMQLSNVSLSQVQGTSNAGYNAGTSVSVGYVGSIPFLGLQKSGMHYTLTASAPEYSQYLVSMNLPNSPNCVTPTGFK